MKRPDNRVVFGRGGTGKTYLIASWLDALGGRQLIFDATAEELYGKGAHIVEDFPEAVRLMMTDPPVIRIAWRRPTPEAWEQVNRLAWAAENLTLVWEEVDQFFKPGEAPEWAFRLVNQGRHHNVRIIATARRPARVSRDLTANAQRIVTFEAREPRDVQYLREFVGEAADQAPGLARYEALDWCDGQAAVKKSPFS